MKSIQVTNKTIQSLVENYDNDVIQIVENIVSQDQIDKATYPTAKLARAEINKQNKKTKDDKNKILKILSLQIEETINEGRFSSLSLDLDRKIKDYELKVRQEKETKIMGIISEMINDSDIEVKPESVFKTKWLNLGEGLPKITLEIQDILDEIASNIFILKDKSDEIKDVYMSTLDLGAALSLEVKEEVKVEATHLIEVKCDKIDLNDLLSYLDKKGIDRRLL